MKKILIFISAVLFFYGCEKDYNSVVEPENLTYQVIRVEPIQSIIYFPGNFTLLRIQFNSIENIRSVALDLITPAGEKFSESPLLMTLIDNNTFTYSLTMMNTYLSCTYTIKYYVTDKSDNTTEAAVQKFNYDNGTANTAPTILNVFVDPDTLVVTDTTLIIVTAAVVDSQGQADIEAVYFVVYRPDGTTSGNQNILSDDGVITDRKYDEIAGDGIFSQIISITQDNAKGTYRFEFAARDRNSLLSNIVSYNVLIQ